MAGIRKLLVKIVWIKMARSILIFVFIFFSCSKEDNCICEGEESFEIYNGTDYDAFIDYLIILLGVKNEQLVKFSN